MFGISSGSLNPKFTLLGGGGAVLVTFLNSRISNSKMYANVAI